MGSKKSVQIEWKFPDLLERLKAATPRLGKIVAATLQTQRGMIFDAEGAHNGRAKWEPLKFREGQILSLTGTLRKSVSPGGSLGAPGAGGYVKISGNVADQEVTLGTKLKYAAVHNFGAVIKPVQAKALRWEAHGRVFFRKKVTIPARPYMNLTGDDKHEINVTLARAVARILNGG